MHDINKSFKEKLSDKHEKFTKILNENPKHF